MGLRRARLGRVLELGSRGKRITYAWLTGTALIHCGLAWQYRGLLKKTALLLAMVTFALCNFAAFLTRSGIFGSLHEFSRSPIGWLFLLLMGMLAILAVLLTLLRRKSLAADNQISRFFSPEAFCDNRLDRLAWTDGRGLVRHGGSPAFRAVFCP